MVVRRKDESKHIFEWAAILPPSNSLPVGQQPTMELPYGFLVSPDSPHRFNVLFSDSELLGEMQSLLGTYISEWNKVPENLGEVPRSPRSPCGNELAARQRELVETFKKEETYLRTFESLQRKLYWEPGQYSLTMSVRTSKPDRVFRTTCCFSLTESDFNGLTLNTVVILQEPLWAWLGEPASLYHVAYPECSWT